MRGALLLGAAAPLVLAAAPVLAQDAGHAMPHDMHAMQHGMMGMDPSAPASPAPAPSAPDAASAPATAADPHAGHAAPAPEPVAGDTPGDAAPPPIPGDHPADAYYAPARMARARAELAREGAWSGSALMVEELEYRARSGRDGLAWKASGWTGGDLDRLVVDSEGEGDRGGAIERAQVRALWRHALDPWFNLEAGVRHDFRPDPQRTYAVVGIEGLAPYWFELEGQVLVSDKGDVHLRVGGRHDWRLSGPLLIQPEAALNLALQDVPELGIGAGAERFELGARLRYEVRPEFAPYVGVHWERSLGATAGHRRASGEAASGVSAVMGIRAWF